MDLSLEFQLGCILLVLLVLVWLFTKTAVRGIGTHLCAFSGILLPLGWGMRIFGTDGFGTAVLMTVGFLAIVATFWKIGRYIKWR